MAQRAVQKCSRYAPFSTKPNAINFNYYGSEKPLRKYPNPIFTSIKKWTDITNVTWPATNLFNENTAMHHFANMIDSDSTAVGCYSAFCDDRASTACVFSQSKARIGTLVYPPGRPCKTGGKCSNHKNGVCEFGLCVITA
ncbi:hypothetical protein KIN20_002802 [Parelaphostrongylus tenuis]|uniref:SCP domain-containing protein n=1 Tax=Parelaphostrongylus tenuis TaxID=148309 RepID=A0AAD5LY90_PARTN|nr:hypothetical protein KIN20_002802 [Parelaphostrongylus tenuis]